MGGATSEVSETTTQVLLESAYFTRTGVLRSARRLDLHSEAAHRFERGTDPEGLERAAARCAGLIAAWAGGGVARGLAEAGSVPARRWVSMRPSRASMLLDYEVSTSDAIVVFDRLRLAHREQDDLVEVEVPGYRVDIDREVDLIEEVARIAGVRPDRLDGHLGGPGRGRARGIRFRERHPRRPGPGGLAGRPPAVVRLGGRSRAHRGHGCRSRWPIRSRPTTRSCARGCCRDCSARWRAIRLAVRDPWRSSRWAPCSGWQTPWRSDRRWRGPCAARRARDGRATRRDFDVLDAKGVLDALMDELAIADWSLGGPVNGPFHPGRSAAVLVGGERAGVLGEIHPRIAADLELEGRVAVAELEVDALLAATTKEFAFRDVPRFPPVRRDLAFVVAEDVAAGAVQARRWRTRPANCWRPASCSTSSVGARCPRAPRASRSRWSSARPTAP